MRLPDLARAAEWLFGNERSKPLGFVFMTNRAGARSSDRMLPERLDAQYSTPASRIKAKLARMRENARQAEAANQGAVDLANKEAS